MPETEPESPAGTVPPPPRPASPGAASGFGAVRRYVAQAWEFLPVRAFVLALGATLAVWGPFLSSGETLSLAAQAPGIGGWPVCRGGGPSLACAGPYVTTQVVDPGAPTWQEMPIDYLLRNARAAGHPRPSWNPWAGSGYPLALDGINPSTSPTRWFLARVPGDQGRDVLSFVRFLLWTMGVVLAAGLAGAGAGALAAVALAATVAPYLTSIVDMVYLDVDLLGPWFLVALLAHSTGRVGLRAACIGLAAFGVLIAALGFLQSVVVLCTAIGVTAVAAAPSTRGRSLLLAAAVACGVLPFLPSWITFLRNLDQFVTSRHVQCILAQGNGIGTFWESVIAPRNGSLYAGTVTLAGLLLIPLAPRSMRFAMGALGAFVAWAILGLPAPACGIPLLSGARFARHLLPQAQFLLLVLVAAAAHRVADSARRRLAFAMLGLLGAVTAAIALGLGRPDRERLLLIAGVGVGLGAGAWVVGAVRRGRGREAFRRGALSAGLVLVALAPFLLGGRMAPFLWDGTAGAPEIPALPERFDATGPLGAVREIARREDRRHYAAGNIVYPNWSSALEIPDLLYLGALYPVWYHELNAGLFRGWIRDPQHVLVPDRFVPLPPGQVMSIEFQRVLAVHRVSLLTFPARTTLLGEPGSPYEAARCRPIAARQYAESWVCPAVGGIGWFPRSVGVVRSREEAVAHLARFSPAEIAETALLGPELDPALGGAEGRPIEAGAGRVISFERVGDDLSYLLDVDRPGPFAIADTWFRGWTATVNGRPAAISRANVAFKAVLVPRGRVELKLHFAPVW